MPKHCLSCLIYYMKMVFQCTDGLLFTEGNPLPLLAKILIPVAGVLLIVVVVFTWYCCVRKKENGDMNDLMIESTLMVNNCFRGTINNITNIQPS